MQGGFGYAESASDKGQEPIGNGLKSKIPKGCADGALNPRDAAENEIQKQ